MSVWSTGREGACAAGSETVYVPQTGLYSLSTEVRVVGPEVGTDLVRKDAPEPAPRKGKNEKEMEPSCHLGPQES